MCMSYYETPQCGDCYKKDACALHIQAGDALPYCSDYDGPVYCPSRDGGRYLYRK